MSPKMQRIAALLLVLASTVYCAADARLAAQAPSVKKRALTGVENVIVAYLANDVLRIYIGERYSEEWQYQYEPGQWGESCFREHFAVYTGSTGTVESEDFVVDIPFIDPGGTPGTVTSLLHAGSVEVTRLVSVPEGNARYFQIQYLVRNSGASTLPDVRFFETVDFDIPWTGDHEDDYGWYNELIDYVGVRDADFFRNGVASNILSSRHGVAFYYDELYEDWDDGELNNANLYGPGDPAVGKQFNLGDLAAGQQEQIILTIWFGDPTEGQEPFLVDVSLMGNRHGHHTAFYFDRKVLRRAQWFNVRVRLGGDYDENYHDVYWKVTAPDGQTINVLPWVPGIDTRTTWAFLQTNLLNSRKFAQIFIPTDAPIGKYSLTADLYKYDGSGTIVLDSFELSDVFVLFNPWNTDGDAVFDDDVYTPGFSEEELKHYVLSIATFDTLRQVGLGFNYYTAGIDTHTWNLNPTNDMIFELALNQVSGVSEAAAAMETLADEATQIIRSCWYQTWWQYLQCKSGGYGQPGWEDVPLMIEEYVQSGGSRRPWGQCLDYAGLVNSFARTVGVPSRMVTCVNPRDYDYHAWDELWLNGEDDEWVVGDATPGELEGVDDRCNDTVQYQNIDTSTGVYTFDVRTTANPRTPTDVLADYKDCAPLGAPGGASQSLALQIATDAPEYQIGETVHIEVTIDNNSAVPVTTDLSTEARATIGGLVRAEPIAFPSRTVTIAAHSAVVESYTLGPEVYGMNGAYQVRASVPGAEASHSFPIDDGFETTLSVPVSAEVGQPFSVGLSVHNVRPDPISDATATVYFPAGIAVPSNPVVLPIDYLGPAQTFTAGWSVTATESGAKKFRVDVGAETAGVETVHASAWVPGDAMLEIGVTRPAPVAQDVSFLLEGEVANHGGKTATNVSVTLTLPPGLSTPDPLTLQLGNLPAGELRAVSWTVQALAEGQQPVSLVATEDSAASVAESAATVPVYSYPHDLMLDANPPRVPRTQPATVILTIRNLGGTDDSVWISSWSDNPDISYSLYDGGTPIIGGPVLVPALSEHSLTMVITPAARASGSIVLVAVSELDPTAADGVTIEVGGGFERYLPIVRR